MFVPDIRDTTYTWTVVQIPNSRNSGLQRAKKTVLTIFFCKVLYANCRGELENIVACIGGMDKM